MNNRTTKPIQNGPLYKPKRNDTRAPWYSSLPHTVKPEKLSGGYERARSHSLANSSLNRFLIPQESKLPILIAPNALENATEEKRLNELRWTMLKDGVSKIGEASYDAAFGTVKDLSLKWIGKKSPKVEKSVKLTKKIGSNHSLISKKLKYEQEALQKGHHPVAAGECSLVRAITEDNIENGGNLCIAACAPAAIASGYGLIGLWVAKTGLDLAADEAGQYAQHKCYEKFGGNSDLSLFPATPATELGNCPREYTPIDLFSNSLNRKL